MNGTIKRVKVARHVRRTVREDNESLVEYVKRNCSTRQKTLAFLKRIGVRKTASGEVYVVPI